MIHTKQLPLVATQIMICLLFTGALITQCWLLPTLAQHQATEEPSKAYLQLPYTIWCVLIIAVFEIALIAVWQLLRLVQVGTVFTTPSRRWVNLIIICASIDTTLLTLLLIHIVWIAHVGNYFTNIILAAIIVFGITFIMIMLVMRQLLDDATSDYNELKAVI